MAKGTKGTQSDPPDPPESETVVLPVDAGVSVYRDNSGKSLGGGPSEGKANFAAVTEAARAIVAAADDDPPPAA